MQAHLVADLESEFGTAVERVDDLASLASQVYEVRLADGRRVVAKVPRVEQGVLAEPRLIDLVGDRTDVPVPDVLLVRETTDPSYFVMARADGDAVDSLDALTLAERERLVGEVGTVLGELHRMDLPLSTFGRVRADADGLHTLEPFETWRPRFADLLSVNVDALAELRLGDLAPRLRRHFEDATPAVPDASTPRLSYFDCKVENLLLSRDGPGSLIETVLDWEGLSTTHWAFTLAFAERTLVERDGLVEWDDADERARLRHRLYAGYADGRGWDDPGLDADWYDTYLLATYVLLAASPYWLVDRDDWDDEAAGRLRSRIREFLD